MGTRRMRNILKHSLPANVSMSVTKVTPSTTTTSQNTPIEEDDDEFLEPVELAQLLVALCRLAADVEGTLWKENRRPGCSVHGVPAIRTFLRPEEQAAEIVGPPSVLFAARFPSRNPTLPFAVQCRDVTIARRSLPTSHGRETRRRRGERTQC